MKYQLREPQQIVLNKIRTHVAEGKKKILVVAATGFGKTILSYEICRSALERKKKVLFTNHRITLAEQSAKKFDDLKPGYLQGSKKNTDANLIVATLQTLLADTEVKNPDIIILDEVHYGYESKLIKSVFEKYPDAIYIGLSATPLDDRGFLLEGFEAIVDDYQTGDLIKLGWLTPFDVYAPMSIDTSSVRMNSKGTDFVEEDLEKVINKDDINESIVNSYLQLGQGRKFICFAVNKQHCLDLAKMFERSGTPVGIISAETKVSDRKVLMQMFASGELKGLLSIEILTAGFDDPTVSCIIFATVTKSWKKYIQCAGRGIRLLGNSIEESIANGKSDCVLLDCAGNIEEHGMPDDRRHMIFGKKISRVIDRELNFDVDVEERTKVITEERKVYLKRIGSLLDLYDGKVYANEAEFQEDVNNYLDKTQYFWWRQNSGKMYKDGRWIHFSSKAGLPDNTAFYNMTSLYFGLELKTPRGYLTDHQKKTLPEMTQKGVLVFIAESVYDVYKAIEHVENNVVVESDGIRVLNSIYDLPERQIELRTKLKLPMYGSK